MFQLEITNSLFTGFVSDIIDQEPLLMISPPASEEKRSFGKQVTPNGEYLAYK